MYSINIICVIYSKPASGKMLKICIYLRKVRLTTKTDLLIGNNVVNLQILLLLEHDSFETLMKKINQKIR